MKKQQTKKLQKLLDAAQQKLDSAKDSKAPKSTIKFLEQRVKALEGKIKKWEKKKVQDVDGVKEQEKTTESGGKTDETSKKVK